MRPLLLAIAVLFFGADSTQGAEAQVAGTTVGYADEEPAPVVRRVTVVRRNWLGDSVERTVTVRRPAVRVSVPAVSVVVNPAREVRIVRYPRVRTRYYYRLR